MKRYISRTPYSWCHKIVVTSCSRGLSSCVSIVRSTVGIRNGRFICFDSSFLNRIEKQGQSFSGRLYCTPRAMWKFDWFLRDFRYDTDLLGRDEVDEKALIGLRGVVRISHTVLNGHNYLNLSGFAPAEDWDEASASSQGGEEART